jgi:alpha-tubulin suppressor-like RCC1 family protein
VGGGVAYCWGANVTGEIGDGSTTQRNAPTAVSGGLAFEKISAGVGYTCGITVTDHFGYCWGSNSRGQLGDGSTTDRAVPTAVAGSIKFYMIAVDSTHTCGVTLLNSNNKLYCWGANDSGELGDGTTMQRNSPADVTNGLLWINVSLGRSHTCAARSQGSIYCWGANASGQLGDGTTTPHSTAIQITGLTNTFLTSGRDFTCAWGGTPVRTPLSCWGGNGEGQLGDGSQTPRLSPVSSAVGIEFMGVTTVDAAPGHTCGVTQLMQLYCWGNNALGQLGVSGVSSSTTPILVNP